MLQPEDFNNAEARAIKGVADEASAAGEFETADRLAMAAIAFERGDEGTAELWLEAADKKARRAVAEARAALAGALEAAA